MSLKFESKRKEIKMQELFKKLAKEEIKAALGACTPKTCCSFVHNGLANK